MSCEARVDEEAEAERCPEHPFAMAPALLDQTSVNHANAKEMEQAHVYDLQTLNMLLQAGMADPVPPPPHDHVVPTPCNLPMVSTLEMRVLTAQLHEIRQEEREARLRAARQAAPRLTIPGLNTA